MRQVYIDFAYIGWIWAAAFFAFLIVKIKMNHEVTKDTKRRLDE